MTPRLALCLLPLATMTLVGCNNTAATDEREPPAVEQPETDRADAFEPDANADPPAPPANDVTPVDPGRIKEWLGSGAMGPPWKRRS